MRRLRQLLSCAVGAALAPLVAACVEPHTRDGGARDDAQLASFDASSLLDAEVDAEADAEPERDAQALEAALGWLPSEAPLAADGRTELLTFELPALERPVFWLRSYAADAAASRALCFQLEEVRADADRLWVPPAVSADYGDFCTGCEQRVAVGYGYGMFILPSAAALPAQFRTITLRIALRDCLTLAPLSPGTPRPRSLLVESTSYEAPMPAQQLLLPLAIVNATPHTFAAGARLDQVFDRLREIWRTAGIELELRGPFELPRPNAPVVYSASDRGALSTLERDAKALAQQAGVESTAAIVVLTPCLEREDEIGHGLTQPIAATAHLPGGFGVHEEPDGIFVAGERCGGLTPGSRYLESESLAAIMAHELGHYLGLFHVRESDGREDLLTDTSPDAPNLMQAQPSAAATALADSQISIARRHSALAGIPGNRAGNLNMTIGK